jgi:uncharacterized protein (UPF0218 family)
VKQLKHLIEEQKPCLTITVGDVVTQNLTKHEIPIDIAVIDNKVLRKPIQPTQTKAKKTLHIKNPAGLITPNAWTTIQKALKQSQTTQILVDGEEDLFTLVAVLQAPENAMVIYGQPNQGLVAVTVNDQTKKKVKLIIDAMQLADEKPK